MFYKFVCVCLLAACVQGAPTQQDTSPEKQQPTVIPIVSQSEELEANGTYKFSYETGNGIKREETSYDKVVPKTRSGAKSASNEGGESDSDESDEIHVQQGSYSYTAPDGTLISVRYIADENGFRPIGDHIPKVAAPSDSSIEKAGRSLKSDDSASSGSAPAIVARAAESKPESSEAPTSPSDSATTPDSSKQAQTEVTPSEASTTTASETNSEAEASATAAPEGTSTNSDSSSTAAPETSTTEVTSTESAATSSTSAADASTESSEATSTASPSSTPSEESSSPAESTTADVSTTEGAISTAAS